MLGDDDLLSLASSQLPEEPLQTVGPVYQIKVADSDKSAFIIPPLARRHARFVRYFLQCDKCMSNLTSPSLTPPSCCLMMECERAKTDHDEGSKLAPYE